MMTMVPALGPSLAALARGTCAAGPSSGAAAATTSGCGSGSGVAFQGRHESVSVVGRSGSGVDVACGGGNLSMVSSSMSSALSSASGLASGGASCALGLSGGVGEVVGAADAGAPTAGVGGLQIAGVPATCGVHPVVGGGSDIFA